MTSTDSVGRIHADHGVATAEQQTVDSGEQNSRDVIAGMVGLDANSQHSALSHRIPARLTTRTLLAASTRSLLLISFATRRDDLRREPRAAVSSMLSLGRRRRESTPETRRP